MASKQKANQTQTGKIAAFVAKYSNASTGGGYKSAIEAFLRYIFNLPQQTSDGHKATYDYEEKFSEYLSECKEKRDKIDQTHDRKKKDELIEEYETALNADFTKFANCLAAECKSKQSARQIMTYARKLLEVNGVKVPDETVMHLKRELSGGRANELPNLTTDMICKTVSGADVRGRAIVLMLASSGLRIGELLAIKFKDKVNIKTESYIDTNNDPVKIYIAAKDSKNKKARTTYISTEATKALNEWIAARDQYLQTAVSHAENLQKTADKNETGKKYTITTASNPCIFPYSDNTITSIWVTMLTRAGIIQKGESNPFNIHTLRGFFMSATEYGGNKALGQYLAGHTGYLDNSYRMAPQSAERDYKKLESVLRCCINSDVSAELTSHKHELSDLRERYAKNDDAYYGLKHANEQLERQVNEMSAQMTSIVEQQKKLMEILEIHEIPDSVTVTGTKPLKGYKSKIE